MALTPKKIIFAIVFGKTIRMKFFSTSLIRNIDKLTIEIEPIKSIDLMERAADSIFRWVVAKYSTSSQFIIFAGNGNNGGDGVALARMLATVGYNVDLYILTTGTPPSTDLAENIKRLSKQKLVDIKYISQEKDISKISRNCIVIDALFGSGLTRPLSGLAAEIVKRINQSDAEVVSIDIPSGLFGEENPFPNPNPVVRASVTLSLQFPKLCFFFSENQEFFGKWVILPIGLHHQAIQKTPTSFGFTTLEDIYPIFLKRKTFDHKGTYGHVLIVAGSYGMIGASVLSAKACLNAGSGLVTVHIPRLGYSILQHSVPEALVEVDDNDWHFTSAEISGKFNAIAFGPGIGTETRTATGLRDLLKKTIVPIVIDADGINIIAQHPEFLKLIPNNTIITPHPGEFDRLFGASISSFHRFEVARKMAKKYSIIIVLKGAFTQIFSPNGQVFFNSTGNPGMATAGSGDVLTGIIGSMLGQGYEPLQASILGVFVHGMAGDIASKEKGETATTASDIISCMGKALSIIEKKKTFNT